MTPITELLRNVVPGVWLGRQSQVFLKAIFYAVISTCVSMQYVKAFLGWWYLSREDLNDPFSLPRASVEAPHGLDPSGMVYCGNANSMATQHWVSSESVCHSRFDDPFLCVLYPGQKKERKKEGETQASSSHDSMSLGWSGLLIGSPDQSIPVARRCQPRRNTYVEHTESRCPGLTINTDWLYCTRLASLLGILFVAVRVWRVNTKMRLSYDKWSSVSMSIVAVEKASGGASTHGFCRSKAYEHHTLLGYPCLCGFRVPGVWLYGLCQTTTTISRILKRFCRIFGEYTS